MKTNFFWFTGMSGSGKSTIAITVKNELESMGFKVAIVDGDAIRDQYKEKLGFSKEDIWKNNFNIANYCLKIASDYDFIFVPIISPFTELRSEVKKLLGDKFFLIHCDADIATLSKRDVKGLYKKAAEGIIGPMIGTSPDFPFERPEYADIKINTGINGESIAASKEKVLEFIKNLNLATNS